MHPTTAVGEALHRTFLHTWYQLPGWVAFVAALLAALRCGGRIERWVGLWMLADYLLHAVVIHVGRELHEGASPPVWWILAVDLLFLPAYLWPVARSTKIWPLFFAAFYVLMVSSRIVRLAMPEVGDWAGVTAVVIWTLLAQGAFTIGVARCVWLRRFADPGAAP